MTNRETPSDSSWRQTKFEQISIRHAYLTNFRDTLRAHNSKFKFKFLNPAVWKLKTTIKDPRIFKLSLPMKLLSSYNHDEILQIGSILCERQYEEGAQLWRRCSELSSGDRHEHRLEADMQAQEGGPQTKEAYLWARGIHLGALA